MHALFTVSNKDWEDFFDNYVELAALGTIADLMPLVGENRVLCQFGLKKWNAQPCRPFLHLTRLLKLSHITSATISFSIAPLFNAIGRLSDPNIAVNLLTKSNVIEDDLKILIETNEKRKDLTQQQYVTCESIIQNNKLFNDEVIVVYGDFHHGLIGILASRIAETFVKPAIVINNNGTASCRSVNGSTFSIIDSLNQCAQFLIKYGGHQAAAGFSICTDEKHLRDFMNALQISAKLGDPIIPIKKYLSILSPEQFTNDIYNDMVCLEPFGQQFPQPIFVSPLLSSDGFTINKSEKGHVTFHSNKNDRYFFFNKAKIIDENISSPFRFFYNSTLNNRREFIIHDVNQNYDF
ncbi:DHH family phosphoesterase [Peribacillus frigoritolerans]|uniref:DHH family phosphoesterase n=1 Tax=Peribacillus frigoritolerans TaxID=450367 RepID=UPI0021A9D4F7|nr:DHH family phosphoesterase [Peribacillus frigoritolerans]MCT4477712.1 DHH family phosphoesterase [Peribacillus frigoritolerans]